MKTITTEQIRDKRKELGLKIRAIREKDMLTMQQMGERLGVDKGSISKIEAGHWNFGIDTLISYCLILGLEIELK